MNRILKISLLTRKRVAAFLLFNFLISTFLVAFPQNKCDGMCSLNHSTHQCSEMKEMTCCDMMGINNKSNSTPCGMEISENSCGFELAPIDNFTFVVPKSIDSKILFIEISNITQDINRKVSNFHILSQNIIPDISPPIYLVVSSFLI